MNNGYIKLWRCIDESSLWQMPAFDILLAIRILTLAKWTDDVFTFPTGEKVKLKRGQLLGGYQWLAKMMPEKSGASIQKIRTALKHLERIEFIMCSSNRLANSHYIIITVLKYNNFQADSNDELTDQLTVELTDHQQAPNSHLTPSILLILAWYPSILYTQFLFATRFHQHLLTFALVHYALFTCQAFS